MVEATRSHGVPTLLSADDHAAVRADPAIAGTLAYATARRGVADTLIVARPTCRGMFAARGALFMHYQYRSPTC